MDLRWPPFGSHDAITTFYVFIISHCQENGIPPPPPWCHKRKPGRDGVNNNYQHTSCKTQESVAMIYPQALFCHATFSQYLVSVFLQLLPITLDLPLEKSQIKLLDVNQRKVVKIILNYNKIPREQNQEIDNLSSGRW